MKLLINVAGNIGGGSMQVAISFINECIAHIENQYYVVLGTNIAPFIEVSKFPSNFTFYHRPAMKFYKQHCILSKIEKEVCPDVVFTVFGPAYWRPNTPHLLGFATAHHLNPESPFWNTISFTEKVKWQLKIAIHKQYIQWECDAIVGETVDVAQRCERFFGNKKEYFTVSNTCNSVFYDPHNCNISKKLPPAQANELRLLTLSKYYRHKNFELYPEIVNRLKAKGYNNIKFIVTIAQDDYNRIFKQNYLDSVINLGAVPIFECPSLYQECHAMFLPTMLESFSASYPEAMLMKKPILTSHYQFAKSVCQDAALYFDPMQIDDIVEKIVTFAENETLRNTLVAKGTNRLNNFPSASQRASQYLQICQSLIKK